MLKNCNGGYIGETLSGGDVINAHRTLMCSKEIERTNRSSTEPHRKTVHRDESLGQRSRRKVRSSIIVLVQVIVDDCFTTSIAVNTRTFVGLYLKQLQYPHRFTRRRHELQLTAR